MNVIFNTYILYNSETYLGDMNSDNVVSEFFVPISDVSFIYIIEYTDEFSWKQYYFT